MTSLATAPSAVSARRAAGYGLLVLTLINLVNYLDRYVVAAVLPRIEADFGIGHAEAGALATVFMVVFMLASPLAGYLGDRAPRRWLVAGSVALWSLATAASGLAGSFVGLMVARAFIGVGEAGYGAVAPSLISDLYPREERTRKLSVFYIAIPVGAAVGYALGGWIGARYGWHQAFYAAGVPGLLLAALALRMPEPQRGAMDGPDAQAKLPFSAGLRGLVHNRPYWAVTAGYTLMTFAVGGLAYWMPSFLERERGMPAETANLYFSAVVLLGGLLGTVFGGWLGDRMDRRRAGGGLALSGWGLIGAAPLMVLAANVHSPALIFGAVFVAQFLIWMNSGPINAAIVNCVPPAFRAFAMGFNVLLIHMLGDAISPPAIGAIADAASLARAIEANAAPVLLGGVALLVGARWLFREGGVRAV